MKIPKYFNKKITPQCKYCYFCKNDDESVYICTINKIMKDYKCPKFTYDPTKRIPNTTPKIAKMNSEDFSI